MAKGRNLKYGEETVTVRFRVPVSKKKEVMEHVHKKLKNYETVELPRKQKKDS